MSVITFKPNDHTKITADFERHEFGLPVRMHGADD